MHILVLTPAAIQRLKELHLLYPGTWIGGFSPLACSVRTLDQQGRIGIMSGTTSASFPALGSVYSETELLQQLEKITTLQEPCQ